MKNTDPSTFEPNRRSQRLVGKLWSRNRHPGRSPEFEHIHLPDDGQVFFKPTEGALQRELRDCHPGQKDHAIAHFRRGEALFRAWRYQESAQAYAHSGEDPETVSALQSRGVALMMVSNLQGAREAFEEGMSRAGRNHSAEWELVCGIDLSQVWSDLGKGECAKGVLRGVLDLARCLGDHSFEVVALTRLAFACFAQASYEEGMAYCDSAIRLAQHSDERIAQADALYAKGVLTMAKGDLATAEKTLRSGIAVHTPDDRSSYTQTRILVQLSSLYTLMGRADEAIAASENALRLCAKQAHPQVKARCVQSLALAHHSAGHRDAARSHSSQSLEADGRAGYRRGIARTDLDCAKMALGDGQLAVARGFLGEAAETADGTGHLILHLQCKAFLAALSNDTSEIQKVAELKHLSEASASAGLPLMEVLISELIGSTYAEFARYPEAQTWFQAAAVQSRDLGCALELAKIYRLQAQLADRQGDRAAAVENAGLADAVLHHAGIRKNGSIAG
ncbi:MAG: tetratricopeptide repeat protein [Candidatus Latescibacterota bacterium]|nr:tetratricopeptide repeat protein [Candidatus Latescibacterota bacterium]